MKQTKVTVFGDSIAKGLAIKDGKPAKLQKNAVDIVQNYFHINIDNQSCFGQTVRRLDEKGIIDEYLKKLTLQEKNIAVISLGGNDTDFDWKAVSSEPRKNHTCKTPLAVFVQTYKKIIKKLHNNKVEVYICALPAVESKLFFENYVCKIAKKENILEYLDNDLSKISRHQELFNNAIRELARETSAKFLDIRSPFLQVRNIKKLYSKDGLHPNEDGQALIADTIINYFKRKS